MAKVKKILELDEREVELNCTVKGVIAAPSNVIEDFLLPLTLFRKGREERGLDRGVPLSDIDDHYGMNCEKRGICMEGTIYILAHKKLKTIDTLVFRLSASSKTWRECELFFNELMLELGKATNMPCICTIDKESYCETLKELFERE